MKDIRNVGIPILAVVGILGTASGWFIRAGKIEAQTEEAVRNIEKTRRDVEEAEKNIDELEDFSTQQMMQIERNTLRLQHQQENSERQTEILKGLLMEIKDIKNSSPPDIRPSI